MKLRQAIKIQRHIEDPWTLRRAGFRLRYRYQTVRRSRQVCMKRSRFLDDRIPYIPDDDELTERFGLSMSIFADILIDDEEEREDFKSQLWADLADA